ncbi:MFS transporter [Stigmatella sp. ncwal1]|uniref:MFS transporter n=1 Tax=Stigmatella ashevillensis TaxID=2995309 RepID=A0ABT5D1C5_9BACT|nr:MFS transporter [Stigmatella ashevillena]MDC0706884.1 MFS transporter [Stigmatella ashevillena]
MSALPSTDAVPSAAPPRRMLLVLAYLAFVSLGLPDAVLGIAWPSIRETFALPQAVMGALLAASASAYFLSGLLAGRFVSALGIGGLLAASTGLVTLGVTGYTLAPAFVLMVGAACIIGFGSGAVDAGLNTYAAQNFGPRHMSWLHAAYSVGAALGPMLMTTVLTAGAHWQVGYAVIAATLGLLAVAFITSRRQWGGPPALASSEAPVSPAPGAGLTARAVLRRPRVWLQIGLFFVYGGIEVTAGQWSYTVLTESRAVSTATAGAWVVLYWGSLLAGRILLGFVVERIGTARLLRLSSVAAMLGALLFALPGLPGVFSALGLAILGFALAPIFPGLMSETPRRVGGEAAAHSVGFQVSAATAGIAILPSSAGLLGEKMGLSAVPVFLALIAALFLVLHELLVAHADRPASGNAS